MLVLEHMPDFELATAVNNLTDHRVAGRWNPSHLFARAETVIYVGCGGELSSLCLFDHASMYIHQDLRDPHVAAALEKLADAGIVSDVTTVNGNMRRASSFQYKGKKKRLLEIFGDGRYGGSGDIAVNVPVQEVDAIYFFAMPYPASIKALQINVLPRLRLGGVFEGPYPYADGGFEGAAPGKIGLRESHGTFVKAEHLTDEEIADIIGYSITQYMFEESSIWDDVCSS